MKEFFKKLLKRKLFWVLLILIVGGVVYFMVNANNTQRAQFITEKVKRGDLVQTVSETGTVIAPQALDLNFQAQGTIKEILVSEGDQVKAGQVLATLDAQDLQLQVKQAQANLDIASANLQKFLAGASPEDVNVTQETVNNAKIAYDNAKINYDTLSAKIDADVKTYQAAVEAAQKALDNASATTGQTGVNVRQSLITTIRNTAIAANSSLDFINYQHNNLGVVADIQAESNIMYYYGLARDVQTPLKNLLDKADVSISESDLNLASNDIQTILSYISISLNNLFNAISSTIVDSRFSQTLVDQSKALVNSEIATNSAAISTLQAADQAYKNTSLASSSSLDTAQANLKNAQDSLNSILAGKDSQLANAKASSDSALGAYNLAKAQLSLKKAAPRKVDIASYQAQVSQAAAALDLAKYHLADYTITAPADGVVTFINYKVGEQASPVSGASSSSVVKSAISMLGNGNFEIDVDVPESDIIKVKIGDAANITLDAYGNDVKFSGAVSAIDVAETVISDVIYYKVKVKLDPSQNEIKSGMTANVDIMTASAPNVLYLSSRSIKQTDSGQKYVEILGFNNTVKQINVETGLKGDTGTEIKSGVSEGQDVIVYQK
ncbi:MAG: biotin/lipoyl-binding protein [Patescibacteria group bacterium]|nr:biotin/lipoyl-binding protein [Patescibacteria group bacterium]